MGQFHGFQHYNGMYMYVMLSKMKETRLEGKKKPFHKEATCLTSPNNISHGIDVTCTCTYVHVPPTTLLDDTASYI